MTTRLYISVLIFIVFLSCSSEIEPTNPYDPESPKTIRAKGELIGNILPEDISDLNKTNFTVTLKETSYNALAERNGNFIIKDIEPGTYTLRVVSSDPAYYDTEIGPINISIGQKTNIGSINLSLKKGSVKGFVKRTDEKNNSSIGVGKVKVTLFSNEKKSSYLPLSSSSICNENSVGRIYYSISEPDGSFIISNIRIGTYRLNSYDEIFGLGISDRDIEIKENTTSDAGTITLLPPSALIRIEDEKISGKVISVTNSEKVKVIFFYGDFLKEFKLSFNESFDNIEWKELGQERSETVELSKGEGLYNIFIKFRDIFCRETPVYTAKVFLDKTPPVLKNIYLPETNNDFINSPNIKVNLSVSDNYSDYNSLFMRKIVVDENEISGLNIDSTFFENRKISYENYKGEFVEPIAGKSGKKVLLLQFKDEAGNESEVIIKEFYFDNVIPEIDITVDGAKSINGTDTVNSNFINIKIKNIAPNKVAEIEKVKVFFATENEPQNWDIFREMYPVVLPLRNGVIDIKVKAMDRAGNLSNLFTKKIAVDTLPPQINSIIVNNNKKYTKSNLVNIEFIGQDVSEMIISNNYNFSGSNWMQYESFLPNYDIGTSEGVHNIYFKFRDLIGNETDVFVKELLLDTTPPCSPENISVSNSRFSPGKNKYFTNVSTPLFSWQYLCPDSAEIEKYITEIYKDSDVFFTGESYTNNIIIPYIQDGEYLVKISAIDRAGNKSPSGSDIPLVIDTIPPSSPKLKKIEYTKINLPEHPSCQFLGYIDIDISVLPDDENITDFKFQISGGYDENCFYINWFTDIKDLPNQLIDEDTVRFYIAQNDITTLMIRGVDEAGNYSDIDFVTITEDSLPPNNIRNLNTENNDSKVLVLWEPPDYDKDIAGYMIYYGYSTSSLNGNFADNGSSPVNVGKPCKVDNTGKEVCEFWLTGVPNGTPFYIDVAAYDDTKPESNIGSTTGYPAEVVAGYISPDLIKEIYPADLKIDPNSRFEAIAERDGLLYLTTSNENGNGGLHIFDVSSPSNPVLLGSVTEPDFKTMHQLTIFGRYALVANGEQGIIIFDISAFDNIRVVRRIPVPQDTFAASLTFNEKYLFVAINRALGSSPPNSYLSVFNIEDITNPVFVRNEELPSNNILDITSEGNLLYVGSYGLTYIYDISDINNILLKQTTDAATGIEISADSLFINHFYNLYIYKYNPLAGVGIFEQKADIITNGIGTSIIVEGPYIYVSTNKGITIFENYGNYQLLSALTFNNQGHYRFDVQNKYNYKTQRDFCIAKSNLFATFYDAGFTSKSGLKIFSLANPRNLKILGGYLPSNARNTDIALFKNIIAIPNGNIMEFATHYDEKLIVKTSEDFLSHSDIRFVEQYDGRILAFNDKSAAIYEFSLNQLSKRIYQAEITSKIITAIIRDNHMYVGMDKDNSDENNCIEEIEIIRISDMQKINSVFVQSCPDITKYNRQTRGLAFYSNYLIVSAKGTGILVYDISDPLSPDLKLKYIANGAYRAGNIAVSGRYLYYESADYIGGIIKLFIQDPLNPALVNLKQTKGSSVTKLVPSGDFLYAGTNDSLSVLYYLSDDSTFYSAYFYNIYEGSPAITGNYAYVSNMLRGISILKIE